MYLESVPHARKFLSAARAVSRLKPVIAIKAGRSAQAAKAAATHTGALSGADAVVEAALRRAGILRVEGLSEMFAAAETVARFRPLSRARLGIVTNGGGAGVLAVDRLIENGGRARRAVARDAGARSTRRCPRPGAGRIRSTSSATRRPSAISRRSRRWRPTTGVDVVLVMNCPTGLAASADAARRGRRARSRRA